MHTPTGGRQKLAFEYDHQGRRIRKQFYTYSGGWVPNTNTVFLYDGWNVMGELNANASNAKLRTYIWGLDLSGTMQGAGGVGGLLKITDHSSPVTHHFVAYDGNGNVAALADGTSGALTARYEYGPFGEAIRTTGPGTTPMAEKNPFRFSTKLTDDQSGFLYYGYRYYNPSTGRWLSRDPLGEKAGADLYAFCENDTMRYVDPDGESPRAGPETDTKSAEGSSEPTAAECSKFPWWGKIVGVTFCDNNPQLTADGKTMPTFLQDCVLRHEGVHAKIGERTGRIGCCIRALPAVRACEEHRAYAESVKCAQEQMKNISTLSEDEQLALKCFLASSHRSCKANKKRCDRWANKDGGPSCD